MSRPFRIAALIMLAGAIISVALAWAAALWGSAGPGSMSPAPQGATIQAPALLRVPSPERIAAKQSR